MIYNFKDEGDGVEISKHDISSSNGFIYPAYLFQPKNRKTKGVVTFVVGGNCNQNNGPFSLHYKGSGDKAAAFYDLVAHDYAVLAINYRNMKLNERVESDAWGPIKCGIAEIDDMLAAHSFIDKSFQNIPQFIWGFSHGGYLVNLLATYYPEESKKWRAIISGAGPWDVMAMHEPVRNWYPPERNPIDKVDKIVRPFLLFHGLDDQSVSIRQARLFLERAESFGIHIPHYFPDYTGHHIDSDSVHQEWMQRFIFFLNDHLPDE